MAYLNRVTLVGRIGRDAELRYTPSGMAVTSFSLATSRTWNDKDGNRQERTDWHKINLWGKAAEALDQYLKKGREIFVEGRLEYHEWEKDGQKRTSAEIRADNVGLIGAPPGGGGSTRTTAAAATSDPVPDDSEIPF